MSGTWREILVDVEPRGKEFRISLDRGATAADVIHAIEGRCKDEGVDVDRWAKDQVGRDFQFVLLRKSHGNALLSPAIVFSQLAPEILEGEEFVFGTQPVVGAMPAAILNRRVGHLVEAFFEEGLAELCRREGRPVLPF